MKDWQTTFQQDDVEIIHQHTAYKGHFQVDSLKLKHRRFDGEWSPVFERELFERGQSAALLLYDIEREQVVLVEQFRVGAVYSQHSPWLVEIVAGVVEDNEQPAHVVIREAKEEAGVEVQQVHHINSLWASPGGSSEQVHLYWGKVDASKALGVHGNADEHEDIRVIVVDRDEAFAALTAGKICNAITIIALQWLQLNYDSL